MKFFRKTLSLFLTVFLIATLCVTAYAHDIPTFSSSGKILSIAHGGNTILYPKNSLAAVQSAFELGADFVSVDIRKTADGQFVLSDSNDLGSVSPDGKGLTIDTLTAAQVMQYCLADKTGKQTEHHLTDLASVLRLAIAYDKSIIIDGEWDSNEEIYKCICENKAINNAIIRTNASAKEINAFIGLTSSMCEVTGEYHGNILFSARSYITSLSKNNCKMIFLGTKNSFGVIFRNGVLSAFSRAGYSARAAMKTWDPNESGGRPDCEQTWSDIIDRGYSVIETDRIEDLVSYIDRLEKERASLGVILSQAKSIDTSSLTEQSAKELGKAINEAEQALKTMSSFDTLSLAKSKLIAAMNNKLSSDSETKTSNAGILNITAVKVIVILLVLLALTVVQIFFYYRQADKKMPEWMKKLLRK